MENSAYINDSREGAKAKRDIEEIASIVVDSAFQLQKHFDTALESPDGIKKLRELILTLAMQGKLVKQDPNDQPASELLKEIQAEKERLIKEGKIKKQKELPPIKPEEVPYKVPEGWVWTRNEEVVTLLGDGLHGTPNYDDNGDCYFINGNNLNDGKIEIKENTKRISEQEYFKHKKQLTNRTVFVSINGTIGNVAFYNNEKVILGKSACYFNLCSNISKEYIKKVLNSKYFIEYAFAEATGSTIKNVSLKTMREFLIPLPPLAEQKRIVAKIDELMALCDKLEAQRNARNDKRLAVHTAAIHQLLEPSQSSPLRDFAASRDFLFSHFDPLYSVKENVAELKKAILTLAMQGKLVKQDPREQPASELLKEIQAEKERVIKEGKIKKQKELPPIKPEEVPYAVPEGWEWVRLGEIGETQTGGTPKAANSHHYGSDVPFIKPGDIIDGEIISYQNDGLSYEGAEDLGRIAKSDSVLMVCIGTIGKCARIDRSVAFNQQINSISPYIPMGEYTRRALQSRYFQKLAWALSSSTTLAILNKGKWENILFPLPPLAEQKRIVAKIDELMALCDKLENQIDQATTKQTTLFDAVLASCAGV
ncbi:MAG: restriction endonuclease subunit S [Candidatus Wallbacteria bacterium HGW-Wallbacteria-1]|jgi:type I restriction enzyme S subunit|uniref:Restriction endonuclease subunit S n=1 Tax=Candidatus Wallbacteria bacterium HGW-Wallbacteria-1 TaxID=2013854 RepID=A0A2N1PKU5_9BACT|nr:MAG: restriction endonuclease subunit S [Candidatus Wallbacteria bacterium HGW-Wallbacteria-1]